MVKAKTLIGSLLVLLALGSVYAWSLFNLPIAEKYGLEIDSVAFTFGIMTLFLALGSSGSGFLKLRIGMQNVVALSAVCTGLGLLIAAFAPNLIVLYISAGVLLGFGDGLGYMLVLTNCVKFFPKHKGLVSALCIGAYGLGSLLFKYVDSYLLTEYNLEIALLTWGIFTAVITTFGSILIYDAMQQASVVSNNNSKREYELQHAIRTTPYWLLSIMFFIDCMVGLYIIGIASNLGVVLMNMTLAEAATAVSVIAIANIAGRLLMGVLSDKLPRVRLITFDQCLSLIAIVVLLVMPLTPLLFFGALALVAFSFGGTLTIYPSIISDFFGIKNLAKNYGLLYLGFGVGSLFGYAAAIIFGSYELTFTMMAGLLVIAIVASLMVRFPPEITGSRSDYKKTKQHLQELAEQAAKAMQEKEAAKQSDDKEQVAKTASQENEQVEAVNQDSAPQNATEDKTVDADKESQFEATDSASQTNDSSANNAEQATQETVSKEANNSSKLTI